MPGATRDKSCSSFAEPELQMSLLFKVLYAAHAHGTHHKLALDALSKLEVPEAENWRRLFFKHGAPFVEGAKAPDKVFKDFKNHVLHPRDGYWGGAPAAARLWYDKTVAALAAEHWAEAAYAAGVLSHYVTDPVHPFHTGQSEAESSVHRAFEWSTAKSYESLIAATASRPEAVIDIPDGDDWLEAALRAAAARSNKQYEKCLAHYDISKGVSDPPEGLDRVAQKVVGKLIRYASSLFALVLSRAIAEAKVTPPDVSLALDTVLATLTIPVRKLVRRMEDRAEATQVARMYDELMATGTVDESLPEDDREVRDLHAAEVLKVGAAQGSARPARTQTASKADTRVASGESLSARIQALRPAGGSRAVRAPGGTRALKPRLNMSDAIVDAPSIGPRMSERLEVLGIRTVEDLLHARASDVAEGLALRYVKAKDVEDWQAQAQLVVTVPGLTGTGAQLLVGAGFREASAVAAADADTLSSEVTLFAKGSGGRRVLRDRDPPGDEQISEWAENSRRALAA
jgi:Domain of unknown function (DUF4332)/Zinc dependent phospholipase C